jgi:hypothetical protein
MVAITADALAYHTCHRGRVEVALARYLACQTRLLQLSQDAGTRYTLQRSEEKSIDILSKSAAVLVGPSVLIEGEESPQPLPCTPARQAVRVYYTVLRGQCPYEDLTCANLMSERGQRWFTCMRWC